MNKTYVSRSGSVIFNFDDGEIVFERAGSLADTIGLESMKVKMSEITAIELRQPSFSKLGGFNLIINGIRYTTKTGQDMTQFAITKKAEFPALQSDLEKILAKNGINGFNAMDSVNVPKEIYQNIDPDIVYSFVNNTGTSLKVYEDYLIIKHTGVLNYFSKSGLKGDKRINFNSISSIECRKASTMAAGYLQFSIFGSDRAGGINSAAGDENSILFDASKNSLIQEIVDYIEKRRQDINKPQTQQVVQQASAADELKKFKELLDMGIITQEEFDAKKKQLLGL